VDLVMVVLVMVAATEVMVATAVVQIVMVAAAEVAEIHLIKRTPSIPMALIWMPLVPSMSLKLGFLVVEKKVLFHQKSELRVK